MTTDFEGEGAGDGDGDRDRDGDGKDGTTSSGHVNSDRVEEVLLAGDSQYKCQGRRKRNGHLPVSSRPPIRPANHPYGDIKRRWRRGHIKLEAINISQVQKVETTYLKCMSAAQPHRDT